MKHLLLLVFPFLITACSFQPDYSVAYKTDAPGSNLKVIYDQRIHDSMGGEENVSVELDDGKRYQIDINGRFSDYLHVDISEDGDWYRFYTKNRWALMGHTEYRDGDKEGEVRRIWKSKNEDPARSILHRYVVMSYLRRNDGKLFRDNRDFGFETSAARDFFGSQVKLESSQVFLGKRIAWKAMARE